MGTQELEQYTELENGSKYSISANNLHAKKLFVKALGTGFKAPIFPKDIQILRNSLGKPEILLSAGAKSYVEDLGITKSHVSLADESNHLLAFAVLET